MCKGLGCTVYLLTVEKLRNANWPREAIDEMFFMPEDLPLTDMLHAVSYPRAQGTSTALSRSMNSTWKMSQRSANTCGCRALD